MVDNSDDSLSATLVTFTGNTAGEGGAISSSGRLLLEEVNFLDNSASTQGGAIHFASLAASMTISDATFTNNSAAEKGGAIAVASLGNPLSLSPDPPDPTDPDERFVMITNAVFSLNSADGDDPEEGGGAIFATTDADAFFSIINSEFLGNSADGGGGGAILLTLGSRLAFVDPSTPSLGGIFASHFFENSAGGTGDDGIGGAIFTSGRLTVVSSSFIDNSSDASGGAIGHNGSSSDGVLTVAKRHIRGQRGGPGRWRHRADPQCG